MPRLGASAGKTELVEVAPVAGSRGVRPTVAVFAQLGIAKGSGSPLGCALRARCVCFWGAYFLPHSRK